MPEFNYIGTDRKGNKVSGKLQAESIGEARMSLRNEGIRPRSISRSSGAQFELSSLFSLGKVRFPTEWIVVFTRQFQVLITSGIPLVQGLELLAEQAPSKAFKNMVETIRNRVSEGSFLWEALSQYPENFPKLYVALVRAGESSGSLDAILRRLTQYMEDGERIRKIIKSAMMYPIVVCCIGAGVVSLMLVFVIPKFEDMLKGAGQELPGPTKMLISLSHAMVDNAVVIVGTLIVLYFLGIRYFRSPEGKAVLEQVLFRTPLFGNLMQKAGIARFSRTMHTLLASGVNLVDAVDICRSTIDNAVLEEAVGKIRAKIESGQALGTVIEETRVFPQMAVQMIKVGESTGSLDKMLEKVADYFEAEVEATVSGLTKLIEPFILVFLGGIVGGMMITMYLPIFKLAGGVE